MHIGLCYSTPDHFALRCTFGRLESFDKLAVIKDLPKRGRLVGLLIFYTLVPYEYTKYDFVFCVIQTGRMIMLAETFAAYWTYFCCCC